MRQSHLVNAQEFIAKWRRAELRERQGAHEHFLDLCALLGQDPPAQADPVGESFCFERGAAKEAGGDGWADVWKKGCFGWEYKGKHKDLDAAYGQLLKYRESLENPPLLVVCDMDRIVVHTNFTGTPSRVHEVRLEELDTPRAHEILRAVFFEPEKLKPGLTSRSVTEEAARRIGEIAQALREKGSAGDEVAHFLDRLVFCMFAEDVGLLPDKLFSRLVEKSRRDPARFGKLVTDLFGVMAHGGDFGADTIRRFNGNLFNDGAPITLSEDEVERVYQAALLDWSAVEPSIFGTLFERGLDPDKRSQIGAHYTSREDIETLIEPVVMQPLRREWAEVRTLVENVLATGKKHASTDASASDVGAGPAPALAGTRAAAARKAPASRPVALSAAALRKARLEADTLVRNFLDRLATVKVLDPACGSGNFLYVTLQKLLGLESEVLRFADERGVGGHFPRVDPRQLYGIEINPYAFDLAQMTVWIGYLQWTSQHGFPWPQDPVLKPSDTIRCMDAILDLSDPEHPKEPEWPPVDFIVSNPPFLGNKQMGSGLGRDYCEKLWALHHDSIPPSSDLCCYWFEKARKHILQGRCTRAGLLATTAIKQVASNAVLRQIAQAPGIFFAESDRDWTLDGASIRISMVGFGACSEDERPLLDGAGVRKINANLTTGIDLSRSHILASNLGLCFMGITKVGAFDIEESVAKAMLNQVNPHRRPNSDVLRPFRNGSDIVQVPSNRWIIDFGVRRAMAEAALYEGPFQYLSLHVKPGRAANNRPSYRENWWIHAEPRSGFRARVQGKSRYLAVPRVAKFRLFVWSDTAVLPDSKVIAIVLDGRAGWGVLSSRVHEAWTLATCSWHGKGNDVTYNPTTVFETFPFPWPPGQEPAGDANVEAIAEAAKELDELRCTWLNPPEWTRQEVLEFPGSADGPWARYLHDPDARGIGTVRYSRTVAKDAECAVNLKARTLTNLYNQRPTWLALAHDKLDAAVFAAYGWDPAMSDDHLLESLLALNLTR